MQHAAVLDVKLLVAPLPRN